MDNEFQTRPYRQPIFTRAVGSSDPRASTIETGDRVALYVANGLPDDPEREVLIRVTWCQGSAMKGTVASVRPRTTNSRTAVQLGSEVAFNQIHVFRLQKAA